MSQAQQLLDDLNSLAGDRRVFVEPFLQLASTPMVTWYSGARFLEALRKIAPEEHAVMDATLRGLGGHGAQARLAREWLTEGGEERRRLLLAYLEQVRGMPLVLGAEWLLTAGLEPTRVGRLVLPALHDKSANVRDRAVLLLARAGQPAADVLPHVERLFASEIAHLWLTGVRALGAIRRSADDQRAAIDQLFVAVRLPDAQVRIVAVQSLLMQAGSMQAGRRDRIIAILVELLRDSEVQVRKEAVDGLGELSAQVTDARTHLQVALADSDEEVRDLARYWLAEEEEEDD